jgi:DNA repair protein RecO (recombination protein O)
VPAAPLITPAIVLGSLRYGETSRIVRLATRDLGVLSAIAKGALRPKSRFGAALQLLSEGQAHLIASRSSDLHTLVAFDLTATHAGLAANLERFGAGSALAEVAARFIPPLANPACFDELRHDIALVELAPVDAVGVVALRALWRLIDELGLGPVLVRCARDGAPLPAGDVAFSLRDGGFLCAGCARQGATTRLGASDRADLEALVDPASELPVLDDRQGDAHRRLVLRWVREHLGDGSMPALEAWAEPYGGPGGAGPR